MIEIDGGMMEGGGQIVRTACGLSALTGKPFHIFNIRAKRDRPGLQPQHMAAVRAVQRVCAAEIAGDQPGSTELTFKPNGLSPQKFHVNIGTAGSTTLILQALMLPATRVPTEVEITGGTDNPFAPSIDYFKHVTKPMLSRLGYQFDVQLIRRGHYPAGQGRILFTSGPFEPHTIDLQSHGELKVVHGLVHCTRLSPAIADRELQAAKTTLINANVLDARIDREVDENGTPGTGIVLWAECENSILGASSLGELQKRAEVVGKEAAEHLLDELDPGLALDSHMGDQIIPYLALSGGTVTVSQVTLHTLTCAKICELFLDKKIEIEGGVGKPGKITAE